MGQQIYKIPRLKDRSIQALLKVLADEFGPFSLSLSAFDHGLGNISFPDQTEKIWQSLLSNEGELISSFAGQIAGVSVYYYRGGNKGQPWERSPHFDDLGIDTNGVDPNKLSVAARLLELARPVEIQKDVGQDDQTTALLAVQEATFARLQAQQEALYKQTVQVRDELDKKIALKEQLLEEKLASKESELEAKAQEEKERLAADRRDLEEQRKKLDDSDNTFARRQIRERMLEDVATRVQNFGVSEATARARVPVAMGMYFLMFFLASLVGWTVIELSSARLQTEAITKLLASGQQYVVAPTAASVSAPSSAPRVDLHNQALTTTQALSAERIALWIRLTLVSIGLVAAIIYYIRWQNSWAQQFSSTEQALQQFHIDVNRANWVVETCLEWKKDAGSEVPSELVESLTRGLFTSKDAPAQVLHPADELASALLGSASRLKLAAGESTVEIDKPGKIPKLSTPKQS